MTEWLKWLIHLVGPGFFLVHFQLEWSNLFRLFLPLTLILSLGLVFRVSFSTALPPQWLKSVSGWGAQGWGTDTRFRLLSILPFTDWLLLLPFRFWDSPSIQSNFSAGKEPSQGEGNIPPSQPPPWGTNPVLIPFFFFFFSYLVTWRFSFLF